MQEQITFRVTPQIFPDLLRAMQVAARGNMSVKLYGHPGNILLAEEIFGIKNYDIKPENSYKREIHVYLPNPSINKMKVPAQEPVKEWQDYYKEATNIEQGMPIDAVNPITDAKHVAILDDIYNTYHLTPYDLGVVLKIARAIASLDGHGDMINALEEAITYRNIPVKSGYPN